MKVTIKDREALAKLTPDMLLTYLKNNEWEQAEDIVRNDEVIGSLWKKHNDTLHKWGYVKVINDMTLGDYVARMAENMMEMEIVSDHSQLSIYAEITEEILIFTPPNLSEEFNNQVSEVLEILS